MAQDDRDIHTEPHRDPGPEQMARFEKQEAVTPGFLAVRDRETMRLLAIAGSGGSY